MEHAASERSAAVTAVAEKAVLVAVEITGSRRSIPAAALMARSAASIGNSSDDSIEDDDEDFVVPKAKAVESDVDFESSLAEFEELARSAGATIAATLVQRRGDPTRLR